MKNWKHVRDVQRYCGRDLEVLREEYRAQDPDLTLDIVSKAVTRLDNETVWAADFSFLELEALIYECAGL